MRVISQHGTSIGVIVGDNEPRLGGGGGGGARLAAGDAPVAGLRNAWCAHGVRRRGS